MERSFSQPLPFPYNLDFEIGEKGLLPKGWFVPTYAERLGYYAHLTDDEPYSGRFCFMLAKDGGYQEGIYGSVMQSVDATPYRGKKVLFRAYIRAEIHSPQGSAHIWIRERLTDSEEEGFLEYHQFSPVVTRKWQIREIVAEISPKARVVNFGLLLFGTGRAWIDNASIEVLNVESIIDTKSLADTLNNYQLDRLIDFANIYGIVRYFSPIPSLEFDWDSFALNGVKAVLTLDNLPFHQVIDSIFYGFVFKDKNEFTFGRFDSLGYICNLHFVFPNLDKHPYIKTERVNIFSPLRESPGIVQQVVRVDELAKKEITLSVYCRGELNDYSGKVALAIRFDDNSGRQISYKVEEFKSISENWKLLSLKAFVPENSFVAKLALILIGEGDVCFDNVMIESNGEKLNILKNPNFEETRGDLVFLGWNLLELSEKSGYNISVEKNKSYSGTNSLRLYSNKEDRVFLPNPDFSYRYRLKDNVEYYIPICLSYQKLLGMNYKNIVESGLYYDLKDKLSRCAIAIILWNVIKHFNLFHKPFVDWNKILNNTLKEVYRTNSIQEFVLSLQKMIKVVDDNIARIVYKEIIYEKTFPFLWKYIDGKVYISKIRDGGSSLSVGSEVLRINNKSTKEFIDSISQFLSFSSEEWKYLKTLAFIRNNLPVDTISMFLKDPNGKGYNTKLTREVYLSEIFEERPHYVEMLSTNKVYIDLTRITEIELKNTLDTLKHFDYFIFDMRGIVLVSEQFISRFIEGTITSPTWYLPVFAFPEKENLSWKTVKSEIKGSGRFLPKQIYFLIDKRTIGIGEVIAEIVRKFKIGRLVGEKTAGNPMETISFKLPEGITFYFGVIKAMSYDKLDLYKKGVEPHIPIREKTDKHSLGKDQILERVLNLIEK
ncbi:MAG: S41 family peptidase [Ignavibacteria bacterium]|nr:S41 family peptidase [Ignavibacteria bacterium]